MDVLRNKPGVDWTRGYETEWRFSHVDLKTWASTDEVANVMSCSYTAGSETDAVETASIICTGAYGREDSYGWLRIEGIVTQGVHSELVQLGTLLFDVETRAWSSGMRQDTLRGVSGLSAASEADPLPDGTWAAKGSDGAARAAQLIAACTPAPVIVDGATQLPDTVVFDLDSKPLSAAKSILETAGWIARPDGQGRIHVMPMPSVPSAFFSTEDRGMFLSTATAAADGKITYTRSYGPGLRVWDLFQANLPEIGLSGTYRVTGQRVTCGNRITIDETVEEVA